MAFTFASKPKSVASLKTITYRKKAGAGHAISNNPYGKASAPWGQLSPIQAKLKISRPGDVYEREADQVAEQVLHTPESAVQRSCDRCAAEGGSCPKCEVEERGLVQRKTGEVSDRSSSVADGFLSDLGSGRPLDSATRAFFEPRFGRDFSQVRVHSDPRSAESARSVDALAYTVGSKVVFGARQYKPETTAGRSLLAHELAHIVQQQSSRTHRIQRNPQGAQAASRSKRVPPGPGEYTAKEYQTWLKSHPKREYRTVGPWEPEWMYARYTPQWFWDRGFLYAGRGGNIPWYWFEVWISSRDRGKEFRVWRTSDAGEEAAPSSERPSQASEAELPSGTVFEGTEDWPTRLDPNTDREDLFGSIIAARENVDIPFGTGDMALYEDGTVELFLEGTTASYVFRPLPGGGYIVYGPDGQRLEMIWILPEEDIPDPNTDAVE